jgi:tRNA A-37 threonylcarbamoyl transferase component Bud32
MFEMEFVHINPRYQALLGQLGLSRPKDFQALPAVIVSGHPDRHVARVMLGGGVLTAFLKREHRVRWRDRLLNAGAGFGFASKCQREAQTLRALEGTGIGCPEWIAVGEDGEGRAFLMVRALTEAVDLRLFLRDHLPREGRARERFGRRLGQALARVHQAGFDHPDLYAKHIVVDPTSQSVWFLDWQRSRRRTQVGMAHRQRDLAALDATLAEDLVSPRDRLLCLRSYLAAAGQGIDQRLDSENWEREILDRSRKLLVKRRIREGRLCPLPPGTQELLWLDGEGLCVTPSFWAELDGRVPDWLRLHGQEPVAQAIVPLPGGGQGLLTRGRRRQPLRWLWNEFRRRPLLSPELHKAGALFRMQRRGQNVPRLLAFGQRRPWPWQIDSFVLTELNASEGRDA